MKLAELQQHYDVQPNMRLRIGIGCLISIQHSILYNFCILNFALLAWPYIDSSCLLICSVDN